VKLLKENIKGGQNKMSDTGGLLGTAIVLGLSVSAMDRINKMSRRRYAIKKRKRRSK